LLLLLLSAPAAVMLGVGLNNSLTGDYVLKVWETDDGLPHNSVTSLVQHSDGFFWIATQGGLVRFDGLQFTAFSSPAHRGGKVRKRGRAAGARSAYAARSRGSVGVAALQRGALTVHPLTTQLNPKKRIIQLFHETDGVFWVVFNDREAWRWNKERVEKFPATAQRARLWPASFARDLDGIVYLSRGSGSSVTSRRSARSARFPYNRGDNCGVEDQRGLGRDPAGVSRNCTTTSFPPSPCLRRGP